MTNCIKIHKLPNQIHMSRPAQKKRQPQISQVKYQDPIIPMCKVSTDVIKKLQTQPYPQLNLATHSTIAEALDLYYEEYSKLYRHNQVLNNQLATILQERNSLADEYNQIKKMKSFDDNIRRRRRYASEIQRNYHCPVHKCNKGYGSEGSLTHHVRLKHPKFFESGDYEIYLETYILPKQETIKEQSGVGIRAPIVIEELAEECDKEEIKDNQAKKVQNKAKQQNQLEVLKKDRKKNDTITPQEELINKIMGLNASSLEYSRKDSQNNLSSTNAKQKKTE